MNRRLSIESSRDVGALSRVVGVLALHGMTPDRLSSRAAADGLRIDVLFDAPEDVTLRCAARLRALTVVRSVVLTSARQSSYST